MATRALKSPPRLLPLYARSAAPLIPGACLLPFVPGGGDRIPEIELTLKGVVTVPERVAAYAHVCGFTLREHLPVTYPHVLAFPLHMAVMADGRFPFGAVGLVHVANRILQRRPIEVGEELAIRVFPTALEPHPRGRTFTLVTEVSVGDEVMWEGCSTMLRRGGGKPSEAQGDARGGRVDADAEAAMALGRAPEGEAAEPSVEPLRPSAHWHLPGDLGRRYAAVSGDRNPIHMHSLSAKLLGFPRAIAHGMWSKARCLAALESRLPDAFEVEVRFRKPILLPAEVQFASSLAEGSLAEGSLAEGSLAGRTPAGGQGQIRFSLSDAQKGTPHLDGRVSALGGARPGAGPIGDAQPGASAKQTTSQPTEEREGK